MKRIFLGFMFVVLVAMQSKAQEQKIKPFSFVGFGVTVTGTYMEGNLYRHVENGVNIFWGLISWGGSETIDCKTGNAVCKIEQILSINVGRTIVSENGQTGFEPIKTQNGEIPVVLGVNGKSLTFAVDISQVESEKQKLFTGPVWKVESSFALSPQVVKTLNLYTGKGEKGYIIPAGEYELYRDGNIVHWTFTEPE